MTTAKLLRRVLSGATVVGLLVGPALVWAATDSVDQSNTNTGSNTTNTNSSTIKRKPSDTRKNTGTATNSAAVKAKTGKNKQKKNTTVGDIVSGMVGVTGGVTNDLNQNASPATLPTPLDVTGTQLNDMTGADSSNKNTLEVRDQSTASTTNAATAGTTLNVTGETGRNEQIENTTGGSITSGDATFTLTISSTLN